MEGEDSTSDNRGRETHHQDENRPPDLDPPRLAPHRTEARVTASAWKRALADRLSSLSL